MAFPACKRIVNNIHPVSRVASTAMIEVAKESSVKPYSEVPGPKPLPILGNTWRVFPVIGQYKISDVAHVSKLLYQEYGKIVKLSGLIGRPDLLFVYDADETEKVYRQEGDTPYRPSMPCLVKYKSQVRLNFFGRLAGVVGYMGNRGENSEPRFKTYTATADGQKYIQPIENVTTCFIKRMAEMRDGNNELPADFDNEIHKWSLECIGRVALDVRLGCLDPDLSSDSEPQKIIDAAKFALRNVAILELKAPYWRYIPTPLWSRYIKNMDYFREVCMKYIDEAMIKLKTKTNTNERDLSLIERILASEKKSKTAYILALDLILVGIDTISMAVCSMLYQLATRPEEQEKLHEELVSILPTPDTELTAAKLGQMHYLKGFIKEVLSYWKWQNIAKDMVIGGYHIPKGVQLVFPTLITGNMPEYVSEPHLFKPERWFKHNDSSNNYIHPFASLPYGHGPRMCLGRRFADLEMQVIIAKLIRSYKLEYLHDSLEYKVTFMYAPEGELKFKMTERGVTLNPFSIK